jgi:hypothetical protein
LRNSSAMKKRGKIILLLLIIAVVSIGIYYWNADKKLRNINEEEGLLVSADSLWLDYKTNETAAYKKYNNKTLLVTGAVVSTAEVDENVRLLTLAAPDSGKIACSFAKANWKEPKAGETVTIKGICNAYMENTVTLQECVFK